MMKKSVKLTAVTAAMRRTMERAGGEADKTDGGRQRGAKEMGKVEGK